jgi:hypothetical protein
MNEKQLELVYEAMRLIKRRSVDPRRTLEQRMSYDSAWTIMWYALAGHADCVAQYDDVRLDCQDCRKFYSEREFDIQLCNACEDHEFFECGRSNVR